MNENCHKLLSRGRPRTDLDGDIWPWCIRLGLSLAAYGQSVESGQWLVVSVFLRALLERS